MWQFLCDSFYDLFHLNDTYGQRTFRCWWGIRRFEFDCLLFGQIKAGENEDRRSGTN